MKVFLDDERQAPEGWVSARWREETIALFETGTVTQISLDHDLGDDERGTSYDMLLWIEDAVFMRKFSPSSITIHSANAPAQIKMLSAVDSIMKHVSRQS
ncbi:cyclic-phosphate processing receiver domain-containing protein [Bordetella sp. FB-8]|uniref:cyclic-phosphate processing receiver domain-containing protein n=1 Tax=Bordetella sp. FB-8 TaxID=1159870 RepID=UPI000373C2FB|nr:cyclic-phosphate processing receiver domain-containing protein [Bordetella sp. FB-8]